MTQSIRPGREGPFDSRPYQKQVDLARTCLALELSLHLSPPEVILYLSRWGRKVRRIESGNSSLAAFTMRLLRATSETSHQCGLSAGARRGARQAIHDGVLFTVTPDRSQARPVAQWVDNLKQQISFD